MGSPLATLLSGGAGPQNSADQPQTVDPAGEAGIAETPMGDTPLVDDALMQAVGDPELFFKRLWEEIERSENRRKSRETEWDILLKEYMPIVSPSGAAETVKVQVHFRNTHTKLGALFYRSPDIIMTAADTGPANDQQPNPTGMGAPIMRADIIPIKQAVLKKKLGRDGIKANRLMDELLFDVLQYSGIGVSKVGYRCKQKEIQVPKMVPAPPPPAMPGAVLGLSQPPPQGQPQMVPDPTGATEPQQHTIWEEWYARRVSPKKALWDSTLASTRFDEDASWTGMDFFLVPETVARQYQILESELTALEGDDRKYEDSRDSGSKQTGYCHLYEMSLKASVWLPEADLHPEALLQVILVKGLKTKAAVFRMDPNQTFDPNTGDITPDSLVGFPFEFLTIRDLADSCFPPPDSAYTNSDGKQMSTWRRQQIRMRDASIGKYLYDSEKFGNDEVEQLKNGDVGEFIPVIAGGLKDGVDKVLAQTSKITASQDDYRGFDGLKQDMNETLGIGSNQAGTETDTVRTATEANTVAQGVSARNDKERERVVDFYLSLVRKFDSLLMRYMTTPDYVEIGGESAAPRMQAWDGKVISGKYLYDIAPDSQLQPDSARDFQLAMQMYTVTAKDPLSNRMYILKKMATQRGWDPAKATVTPVPTPPRPEPPKISIALNSADLINPLVVAMLEKMGYLTVPEASNVQPPHGGALEPAEAISQHLMSNSGGTPNAPGAANHRATEVK